MSAIIKFFLYSRKNKNSHLQHSSCSVQTQDYQISLKTRNIFCVAFKDVRDVRAGGSSSSVSWEGSDSCSHLQPQSTTRSAHDLSKNGAAPPWTSLRLLPELGQLSMDHSTGVTGKSSYRVRVISAELIAMPILRFFSHKYFWPWSEIFSSLLMSRRYCTAAQHPRKQHWTSVRGCINSWGCQALCLLQWEPSQGND